ncbi:hypothetical protein HDU67_006474 [Dinochytrium kinnereticum]|nr:hypothetical protein HDU67_006474 [Dinochytrium kinnereticum]
MERPPLPSSSQYEVERPYRHAQYEIEKSPSEYETEHLPSSAIYEVEKLSPSAQYEVESAHPSAVYEVERSIASSSPSLSFPSLSISVPGTPRPSTSSITTPIRPSASHPSSPYFYDNSPNFPPTKSASPTRNPTIRDSGVSFPNRGSTVEEDDRPVVLITGCSRGGIGYSLMISMASKGCRVFGTVRDVRQITELSNTLHHVILGKKGSIEIVPMDVTDSESVRRAVGAVVLRAGKIDILVNNAGVALSGPLSEMDLDACRILFETNVVGLLGVIQEQIFLLYYHSILTCIPGFFLAKVVPYMVKRRSGKIINMGSMIAYVSLPWSGVYCASKSAVRAITSSLRMELIPFGIQVSLVCAGTVRTNLIENIHKLLSSYPQRRTNTLYGPIRDRRTAMGLDDPTSIKTAGIGTSSRNGTDPDVFAEEVANEIMKDVMAPSIMSGKWWWVILVFLMFPEGVIEFILAWRYGLKAPDSKVIDVEKKKDE